jgi:hypothetical protein
MAVAETTTTEWVKEARRMEREATRVEAASNLQKPGQALPQLSRFLIREILQSTLQRGFSHPHRRPTRTRRHSRKFYD